MSSPRRQLLVYTAVVIMVWLSNAGLFPAAADRLAAADRVSSTVNAHGLDITIRLDGYAAPSGPAGSLLAFDGQNGLLKAPGAPELPVIDLLIGVPAAGEVTLAFTTGSTENLQGRFDLPAAEVPAPLTDDLTPGTMMQGESNALSAAGTPYPAAQALIAGEAWVRGQRVVRLQIAPFQYTPSTGRLTFTPDFDLAIRFSNPAPSGCTSCAYDVEFEQVLQEQLVNYEQSRPFRIPSGSAEIRAQIQSPLTTGFLGPRFEFVVDRDGIYRVSYADLLAAGMDVDAVDPRKFKLFNQGSEVSIRVSGESDGSFDPGDYILF